MFTDNSNMVTIGNSYQMMTLLHGCFRLSYPLGYLTYSTIFEIVFLIPFETVDLAYTNYKAILKNKDCKNKITRLKENRGIQT